MRQILLSHFEHYPQMAVRDAIKLLYQSAFGCGHFVEDAALCLARTAQELAITPPDDGPLTEPIGGGYARLHLGAAKAHGLRAESIASLFMRSANAQAGQTQAADFARGVEQLRALQVEGLTPFASGALEAEIASHERAGCPAVHHSEHYTARYAPAYRVIDAKYLPLLPVIERIDRALTSKRSIRVALDGRCGAGKSMLGAWLADVYGAPLIHMDDFFLPIDRKTRSRLAQPGENIDHERFFLEVVQPMRSGQTFSYRPYHCHSGEMGERISVDGASPVIIVEGVYSLHPSLRGAYDLCVFLDIDPDTQIERIRRRNGEAMLGRFVHEWIPLEEAYFTQLRVRELCELCITSY